MTVALPYGLPVGATSWTLTDVRGVRVRSAQPAAGGTVRIDLEQLDLGERWLIDHAVISCSSTTPTTLRLYEGNAIPGQLLDGSNSGNFDVADWPAGLLVSPGQFLVAVWAGASDGATATLYLQIREFRKVG